MWRVECTDIYPVAAGAPLVGPMRNTNSFCGLVISLESSSVASDASKYMRAGHPRARKNAHLDGTDDEMSLHFHFLAHLSQSKNNSRIGLLPIMISSLFNVLTAVY